MHRFAPTGPHSARLMAAVAVAVAGLSMISPSATRPYVWPWAALFTVMWLAPLVVFLTALIAGGPWRWPPAAALAGLGGLAGATLGAAALSPFARLSLLRVWPTLSGAAACLWVYDWLAEDPRRAPRLGRGLAAFAGLLAVVCLVGGFWESPSGFWAERNSFPFGHSNYTAGALLLALPWLVREVVLAAGWRRWALILVSILALLAMVSTSSRAGVLALAAIAAVAGLRGLIGAPWSRGIKVAAGATAAGLLAVIVLANPRLRQAALGQGWSDASRESNAQRRAMALAGWRLGASRPITGWGPGSVPLAYPRVRAGLDGGVDDVLELHDTPLQIWATTGGAGILAATLLLGSALPRLARCLRAPAASPTASAAAASLAAYGLFCLTDHQLDVPALNGLALVNFALLLQDESRSAASARVGGFRRLAAIAASVAVAALLVLTGRDLRARRALAESLDLADAGQNAESLAELGRAAVLAPYDPFYRQRAAIQLLELRGRTADPAERTRLILAAAAYLESSLGAGCFQEFAHFNLGWIALETGDPGRAIPHFLAAAREAPQRSGLYFGLGLAWRRAGREKAAVRAFALEWINDPVAFTAPVWEWPDFSPLRPRVVQEADRLLTELAATQPTAAYVRAWWGWWATGATPPAAGFNSESDRFLQVLRPGDGATARPPELSDFRWGALLAAWRRSPAATASAAPGPALRLTLIRRATRHPPPDWHGFFTAGLENEPALLTSRQFSRLGHPVLTLHPDAPPPLDLYVRQENAFVSEFASGLFPPKGWVPARQLLAWLPDASAVSAP